MDDAMHDHAQLHDLCRLRSDLEAFAVMRWRRRAGWPTVDRELRRLLALLERLAKQGDYESFHKADQKFHRAMVASADMAALLKSWDLVAAELDPFILSVKKSFWPNLMALYREHELLLEAWCSDDEQVSVDATHQHLEAGWYRLKMASGSTMDDVDPVQHAVSFIATHFASHLDIRWVARHVSFVSSSHLSRLFRSQRGTSPLRYLKQVRLERAAQLLLSGTDAVSVIARRVGYRNVSHFVRDFRRTYRATPLGYRKHEKRAAAKASRKYREKCSIRRTPLC